MGETDGTGISGAASEARTPRFEILIAVLLGVTALMTAGAAFLADRDDGQQLLFLQQAATTQSEANDAFANGDQVRALDQAIFIEYALAAQQGDDDLAGYLLQFSPDLQDAIEVWADDPNGGETPFSGNSPAYYPARWEDGETLREQAAQEFERGDFYDQRGDKFVAATVLLAVALALFGVASVIWFRRWRLGLTVGGSAFMVAGAAVVVVNLV
jgi:hypothetical protein